MELAYEAPKGFFSSLAEAWGKALSYQHCQKNTSMHPLIQLNAVLIRSSKTSCNPDKKSNYPVGLPISLCLPFLLEDTFQTKCVYRSGRFLSGIEEFPFLIKKGSSLMVGVYHRRAAYLLSFLPAPC